MDFSTTQFEDKSWRSVKQGKVKRGIAAAGTTTAAVRIIGGRTERMVRGEKCI